jgi:hypothetical protein
VIRCLIHAQEKLTGHSDWDKRRLTFKASLRR